ncbi:helix-turn-helix transcriptional regulator [Rhizobium ruizarguesonis]|uniref:helix-turn-helix transcriptional regulator n=2 Tax=Rhizobium/Agrobacterium group TaxID=227290 RepID=UPI003857D007
MSPWGCRYSRSLGWKVSGDNSSPQSEGNEMSYDGFYTLHQVIEMSTMSESTIRRMTEEKRFPPLVPISKGRVGVHKRDFHRWEADPSGYRTSNERQHEDDGG